MVKLTIEYMDGYKEHYTIMEPSSHLNTSMGLKRYKDVIEDGMLKLVIDGQQLVLIPIVNIRKVIAQGDDILQLKVEEYPGFMSAKIAEEN
jgi:hypothetical protein